MKSEIPAKKKIFVKKNKNIAGVIYLSINRFIFITILSMTLLGLLVQYITAVNVLKSDLQQESRAASGKIEWVIQSYKNIVETLGTNSELTNTKLSSKLRYTILQNRCNEYGFKFAIMLDEEGYSERDGMYRGDREYFKRALKGDTVIEEPILSRLSGEIVVPVAAPIWKAGIYNGTVTGVIYCAIGPEVLNTIISKIELSKRGDAYIITEDGRIIASNDINRVFNEENIWTGKGGKNPKDNLSKIKKEILDDRIKVSKIHRGGVSYYYASSKIIGTPNWYLVVESPVTDYVKVFITFIINSTLLALIMILLSKRTAKNISDIISKPVFKIADRLKKASAGDFRSDVEQENNLEELTVIAEATESLLLRMNSVINGMNYDYQSTDLQYLINFKEYEMIHNNFSRIMNINFCLYDGNSKLLLGTPVYLEENKITVPLIIDERIFGTYEAIPLKDCTLSNQDLEKIVKCVVIGISKIIENRISLNNQVKAWKDNEKINIRELYNLSENLTEVLHQWLNQLEYRVINENKSLLNNNISDMINDVKVILNKVEESSEFLMWTDFGVQEYVEEEYDTTEFLESIKKNILTYIDTPRNFSFNKSETLPQRLFGDINSITKIITRLAMCLESKNFSSPILIDVSSEQTTYGVIINTKIEVTHPAFTKNEFKRIKILVENESADTSVLSSFEQKFISAKRLASKIYSKFSVIMEDDKFVLVLSIPQLPVEDK